MFNCIKTGDDKLVGIIELPLDSFRKPYKAKRRNLGSYMYVLEVLPVKQHERKKKDCIKMSEWLDMRSNQCRI